MGIEGFLNEAKGFRLGTDGRKPLVIRKIFFQQFFISMASKNMEMQAIFNELSEKNKDIVILIARSMKVAQEAAKEPCGPPAQETESGVKR